MSAKRFLGIDIGTQGLSAALTDEAMRVLATGEGGYEMIGGLGAGCYEQNPADWEAALKIALMELRKRAAEDDPFRQIQAIGISGQMHGEVMADAAGRALGPARLWCDARNEAEGLELTKAFGVKIPKRLTVARWLWTLRNHPDQARGAARLTTPGGWLAYRLAGQWRLGIGDASGMFPIDQQTLNYDVRHLRLFDGLTAGSGARPLIELLPRICKAGEDGGVLQEDAAKALGLPAGIPVAPAEGDQPAAMAGSLIADAGMVSMSFGTSVCANSIGDRAFHGVHSAIDHFRAADGKPINMAWLRNGTTFMNRIVEMFAGGGDRGAAFAHVMPMLLDAPPDCGGVMALPFIDDEPALGIAGGGAALLAGLNRTNTTPGNLAKAALLATMYNLRIGADELARQGFPRKEIILSGGLTRTPALGRILADVFDTPVALLDSASEGSAWGAALLAKFRWLKTHNDPIEWSVFLGEYAGGRPTRFTPRPETAAIHKNAYERHLRLLQGYSAPGVCDL